MLEDLRENVLKYLRAELPHITEYFWVHSPPTSPTPVPVLRLFQMRSFQRTLLYPIFSSQFADWQEGLVYSIVNLVTFPNDLTLSVAHPLKTGVEVRD